MLKRLNLFPSIIIDFCRNKKHKLLYTKHIQLGFCFYILSCFHMSSYNINLLILSVSEIHWTLNNTKWDAFTFLWNSFENIIIFHCLFLDSSSFEAYAMLYIHYLSMILAFQSFQILVVGLSSVLHFEAS